MAGFLIGISGISGSFIAAILHDAAKGINQKFNTPFSKALEDTSLYFLNEKSIEFRVDKLLDILAGDDSEIEKLKSGDGLIDGDEFALQFAIFGGLYFEDQSKILPIAKEIVDYFIKRFEYHLLTDPKTDSIVLKDYIEKYGQSHQMEHLQIIESLETTESRITEGISAMGQRMLEGIEKRTLFTHSDASYTIPVSEYQEQIDYSRKLLQEHSPQTALNYLMDLRKRIWHRTDDPLVRFRILTNMGSAHLELEENVEASRCFIEALQYQPKDEKALCNAAIGYFLIGNKTKCQELLEVVLGKNPANLQALSLRIETSDPDQPFEDVVESVPEKYRNTAMLAVSLGVMAEKLGKLREAQEWFRISIQNDMDSEYKFLTRAYLGNILLHMFLSERGNKVYLGWVPCSEETIYLEEIVELLTQSWDEISTTELTSVYLWILANRAKARFLLGQSDEAIKDIDDVLSVKSSDVSFRRLRAVLALGKGDAQKAISLLQDIQYCDEFPDTSFYLALALSEEERHEEAKRLLADLLERDIPESLRIDTCSKLIDIYLDLGEFEETRNFTRVLYSDESTNPCYLAMCAKAARCEDNMDNAIEFLDKARENITDATPVPCLHTIANEFFRVERFEDAAHVFSTYVNTMVDSPDLHDYLLCLYRVGDLERALEICKSFREAHGPVAYITLVEVAINEEIGDLGPAEEICKGYLLKFPDDAEMRLRLALINYRQQKLDKVDTFLEELPAIEELTLLMCLHLAFLLWRCGRYIKALDIMYETRRRYFREQEAHLKYIGLFFQLKHNVESLLNVEEIGPNVAVLIAERWFLIEDRAESDLVKGEYTPSHPLINQLLGKRVGEVVRLSESDFFPRQVKVQEIKSKYIHALHESLEVSQYMFPDLNGLEGVHIGKPEEAGGIPPGFQKILDWQSRQYERGLQIEQLYREGKLTIGGFAEFAGIDVVRTCFGLMTKPELGIRCSIGSLKEREEASRVLERKPKFIADLVALLTLHRLEAGDLVVSEYGKLNVALSTKEAVRSVIEEESGLKSYGYMFIGKEGDDFVRQEVSAEDVKRYIDLLENLLEWIEKNCEEIPCYRSLTIRRDERQKLDQIGHSFVDSILVAQEEGMVLLSDDRLLRALAKGQCGVDGVWTQSLLKKCRDDGSLAGYAYNGYIVKLACSRYYHTAIDGEILLEAARQSDWQPVRQFKAVANHLGGKHSDIQSAIGCAANFMDLLWRKPALPDPLIHGLLDSLVLMRDGIEAMGLLKQEIINRFGSQSLNARYILRIIRAWESTHVLLRKTS